MKTIILILILTILQFFILGFTFDWVDGVPSSLIAHYKMNEDTASDNNELISDGDFAADTAWTLDGTWAVADGVCSADGNEQNQYLEQNLSPRAIVGRKYKIKYEVTANTIVGTDDLFMSNSSCWNTFILLGDVGVHTITKVCTREGALDLRLFLGNLATGGSISIDNISVKLFLPLDSSGNDHDGLLQEDTDAAHVTGKVGGAFDFDGSADYIEIADHDDFTPALTPFSISAWVYMHTATYFVWASKWQVGSNQEWLLFTGTTKKIHFRMYDDSENAYIGRTYNTSLASYENQWTHFVATYDGGTLSSGIKIYLNGVRVDDADSESGSFVSVENLTAPVWIGRYDTKYANGLIDNVTFFSKELDQSDVNFLYHGSHGREDWTLYLLARENN